MYLSNDVWFKQIIKLEPVQEMQAYFDPTVQCRTIVGATTIISGILNGSRPLIIGSIIGSFIAWYMSSKTSRHVPHILSNEITLEQRGTFLQCVRKYLRANHIYTLEDFMHFVTTCDGFLSEIIRIVMLFLADIGYIELWYKSEDGQRIKDRIPFTPKSPVIFIQNRSILDGNLRRGNAPGPRSRNIVETPRRGKNRTKRSRALIEGIRSQSKRAAPSCLELSVVCSFAKHSFYRSKVANGMEDVYSRIRLAEVSPPESLLTRIYYATKDGMPFAVYNLLNSRRRDKANCLINQKILGADGHHCTPLIIAAYYGHDNVVNMLLNKFKPNLEEEGTVKFDECSVKGATALWCAAAAGYLAVVKTLVKAGADVNHTTEQNSTPLRAACFIGRLDIVKYLIEHNADVNISNYLNNTCLMLAAHKGYFDLVLLLLERGAKRDAKANCSATALHFAAEGGHADIVLKLLQCGTNVTKDVSGMTPLLAAAKCAKEEVVECLIEWAEVTKEETIDAYELLGAAYVNTANKNDDFLKVAYKYLLKAMELRFSDPDNIIRKKLGETVKAYDHWKECETLEKLRSIENNQNAIHMEALAIQERILGKHNPDVAYHIIFRGAIFADNGRFDRSIDLWFYALYLQQLNNVSVANDLLRFAQVFAQMIHIGVNLEFSQLLNVLEASVTELTRNKSKIHNPDSKKDIKKHIEEMESNVTSTLYMLSLLTRLLNLNKSGHTEQEKKRAYYQVHKLCALQLHLSDGQTLLHLAVNEKTPVDGFYIHRICKFPCATTTKLLVFCGADVNAMDNKRNTPLHTIVRCRRSAIDVITFGSIIHELVDAGAHVDIVNNIGMTPYDVDNIGEAQQMLKIQAEMSLKCIAARVIKTYKLPYLKKVPRSLERFIELHGPILHST